MGIADFYADMTPMFGDETLPRLAVSSPAAEASVPPPAPEVRADPAGVGH